MPEERTTVNIPVDIFSNASREEMLQGYEPNNANVMYMNFAIYFSLQILDT